MDSFQKDIDERANLALSNKFELLLFRLGTSQHESKSELYGINVFKLREIVPMQKINRAAGMMSPLLGVVNIRDQIMPVSISLQRLAAHRKRVSTCCLSPSMHAALKPLPWSQWITLFAWTGVKFMPQIQASVAVTLPVSPAWKTKTATKIWR